MSRRPLVVKVGGSLLEWPDLPDRLGEVIDGRTRPLLLIAGGGAVVDAIRRLDATHSIGEETSHWLAIRGLDLTARILAKSCRVGPVLRSLGRVFDRWEAGGVPVLAPYRFLKRDDGRPGALPHSWDVTSDSIAARVARRLLGDLLLLKSAPPGGASGIVEAARLGLVDPAFPKAAAGVRSVWYRNLRDPDSAPQKLAGKRAGPGSSRSGG